MNPNSQPTQNSATPSTGSRPPARREYGGRPRTPRSGGYGPQTRPQGGRPNTGGNGGGRNKAEGGRGKRRGGQQHRRRSNTAPALTHRMTLTNEKNPVLPEVIDDNTVRVIPVSGVEEIGRNMIIVETKDDMVVIDAGFQFVSEESNAPGINYILPNTQYIEERKHKLRALIVTHGHLDHIGGIPFIMERIGNPPIYTQYLTSLMILKRQEEFPHMDPVTMQVVQEGGKVVVEERASWEKVCLNNNLVLLCDSTNADREGFSASENLVYETLDNIIRAATGRLIIGTFASQFDRLISIIKTCEDTGKKVVMEGRSIKTNIDIAIAAKLLEVKPHTFINAGDIGDYPSDKIVVLSTGAQGEEFAALMRMATDKHKQIILTERDTVVLSSSIIPGNEIAVQKLNDNIYRKNVRVINYKGSHVHSSGHGNAGELVWVHQAVKPKFLVPVHGQHYHLKSHMYAAVENGFPKDHIVVPDNGTIIDIKNGTELIRHSVKIPTELMMVDGFTVGIKQEVVLRDRLTLAQDGMFVIIATVNSKTGKLRKSPDIISRGFVYLRENQQLLSEARVLIKRTVEKETENMNPIDLDLVKDQLTDVVSGFLMQKTQKTPMVIPVLIGV